MKIKSAILLLVSTVYLYYYSLDTSLIGIPPAGSTINFPTQSTLSYYYWYLCWLPILFIVALIFSRAWINRFNLNSPTQQLSSAYKIIPIFLIIGAFVLSVCVQELLLFNMLLTDDESAYIFAADLIHNGKLYLEIDHNKIFFDRVFMINDGRYYPQYFWGWPAILSLGIDLGIEDLVNSLFFVGSVYLIFKHLEQQGWFLGAVAAALMLIFSATALVNSATFLSHSSCSFFIMLFINYFYKYLANKERKFVYLLIFSISAAISFNIRPFTALCILLPYSIYSIYLVSNKRLSFSELIVSGLIFLLLSTPIFILNYHLSGDPFKSGYEQYLEYAVSNDLRFSFWNPTINAIKDYKPEVLPAFSIPGFLSSVWAGMIRVSSTSIGLPTPILLIILLVYGMFNRNILPYSIILCILGHAVLNDMGIDTWGPVHLSEIVPLIIILFVQSINRLSNNLKVKLTLSNFTFNLKNNKSELILAFPIIMLCASLPYELNKVNLAASNIQLPYKVAKLNNISNAVVFVNMPFIRQNSILPFRHFRFWHDIPNASFTNDIIWVHNIDKNQNMEFMKQFPDRKGYVLEWFHEGYFPKYTELGQYYKELESTDNENSSNN
jgi:hypothetical protein